MLYSKSFRLPSLFAAALLIGQLGLVHSHAQQTNQSNDLFGNNLKLPSSEADKNLIDPDSIATPEPEISPAEAAEVVRKKVGGQVMSVNTQHRDSGVVYGVKVLNDGRMRVIHVDGNTGRLLKQ